VLTKRARAILARYRHSFGQKNVLSVGVELFDKLDPAEKIRLTDESDTADQAQSPTGARELWETAKAMISDLPETALQFLSPEEQQQAQRVRHVLGPAPAEVARRVVTRARSRAATPQEKTADTG